MNFAIKHPNKHFTPPIIFILQSRSSKRGCFMQSWLHGEPPPCTEQPIGIKRGLAGKPRAQNRQQKQRNTRRTTAVHKTANKKRGDRRCFYHFSRRLEVFVGHTRGIRGVFVGYMYVSGMCRECIGYVSGIYRKIRGGKNEEK